MHFFEMLKIEFLKVKRSRILPLIFIAPVLVIVSGLANLSQYLRPEYQNAWGAMFIQSALVYAYYLLPLSMVVVCAMIAGIEKQHNGILKMMALPVHPGLLSLAKFCVLVFYLLMEMVVFFVIFSIAGLITTRLADISEAIPILYLMKWCIGLFLTMLPSLALMWAITVLLEKPLFSVGINFLLILPGVLVANTPFWILYPFCYSGYLVTGSLHEFTMDGTNEIFPVIPFVLCASFLFFFALTVSYLYFGKKNRG